MTPVRRPVVYAARIALCAGCASLAWRTRFVQDDAYISWRYAENLVHGHGLVWNAGERIEGYTNFLWTLVATVPIALSRSVETFCALLGVALFTLSLLLADGLARRLSVPPVAALLATLALGTLPSFTAYATGGLETQLQTVLVLAVVRLALSTHAFTVPRSLALGLVTALALATRLDTAVLLLPPLLARAYRLTRDGGPRALVRLLPGALVAGALLGAWFAWKIGYYHALLPNTLRAKVGGAGFADDVVRGLVFAVSFVRAYAFYLPLLALGAVVWTQREWRTGSLLASLALWTLYVVRVGGDFMEYRFVVPALPLVIVVAFVGASRVRWSVPATVVLALSLYVGNWRFAHGYDQYAVHGPEPVVSLAGHLSATGDDWSGIGRVLRESFTDADLHPSIAVTPAGAIPYFSRLPSVDMLGLNDADVDHFLVRPWMAAGHTRLAPLSLLRARRTTFLIAQPVLKDRRTIPPDRRYSLQGFSRARQFRFPDEDTLRGTDVVEVPLGDGRVMLMVYLSPTPAVDARLASLGWRRYPLH